VVLNVKFKQGKIKPYAWSQQARAVITVASQGITDICPAADVKAVEDELFLLPLPCGVGILRRPCDPS